ncbi:MAG: DUF2911 domain-containing protein [Gemmatimonadales bacterium]|nr:MAG: DUF2911 domain-containing protein [Gemmatimonadales bacterium]
MPKLPARFGLLPALLLVALPACGTSEEAGTADAATADTMVQVTPAAAVTGDMECFVRGATLAEAANRASPIGQTAFTLDGEQGLFCYGRPSASDRVVMGELVPYGAPWRLGANEATAIHLPVDATVGGVEVDAGSYSLYVVPTESEWTFHINRQVERWGIPIDADVMADDVGTFTRPVAETDAMVETLSVTWEARGASMGHLVLEWENTRIEVPVEARSSGM